MHEWHTETSKNILSLVREFDGFVFERDGRETTSEVSILDKVFKEEVEARTYVTNKSYGGRTAYIAAYTQKKLSKAYQNAFASFLTKYKDYKSFKANLTIGYGRTSLRVTCPYCDSSITLKYGGKYKACPVCGSPKIISDSNWKILDTKQRLMEKAAENLSKEATKNDVTFLGGIEWHC